MPDIEFVRAEIERMRVQVQRQRWGDHAAPKSGDIHHLSGGVARPDAEQDRRPLCRARQAEGGAAGPVTASSAMVRWFDDEQEPSPFLKALEEVRRMSTREGWRYQHVQAIIVAIDQYAEAATGNRDFFLNKPPGARRADMPGILEYVSIDSKYIGKA